MIKELKLINRSGTTDLFNSSADIDFDSFGNLQTVEGEQGLHQCVGKAILTSKQDDGYGTNLSDLIGKKNTRYVQTKSALEVLTSLTTLKKFQYNYKLSNQQFDSRVVLYTVYNVIAEALTKTSIDISLKLNNLYNVEYNENSLPELTLTIND